MTGAHAHGGHEAALAELLAGPEPELEFGRSPLAGCAACRAQLEALMDVREELDRAGAREREELARASAALPARGPAEEALLAYARTQHAGRRSRRFGWLLAAAAVLAVFGLWFARAPEPGPDAESDPGQVLGDELQLLEPVGRVEGFARFRWSARELGSGWYRVLVQPESAAPGSEPFVSPNLRANEWNPEPETIERWGKRIRWRVEFHRGTGSEDVESVSPFASAERP